MITVKQTQKKYKTRMNISVRRIKLQEYVQVFIELSFKTYYVTLRILFVYLLLFITVQNRWTSFVVQHGTILSSYIIIIIFFVITLIHSLWRHPERQRMITRIIQYLMRFYLMTSGLFTWLHFNNTSADMFSIVLPTTPWWKPIY